MTNTLPKWLPDTTTYERWDYNRRWTHPNVVHTRWESYSLVHHKLVAEWRPDTGRCWIAGWNIHQNVPQREVTLAASVSNDKENINVKPKWLVESVRWVDDAGEFRFVPTAWFYNEAEARKYIAQFVCDPKNPRFSFRLTCLPE